jgi:hypothetical protein
VPISNLLTEAWKDLHELTVVWQLAILLGCIWLAWAADRALRNTNVDSAGVWQFGVGGLRRILFPLVALIPLIIAIGVGRRLFEVNLLRLFVPVLASWLLVRVFFYLLRYAFAKDSLIRTFERTIASVVWGALLLHVFGLLPGLIEFLDDTAFHVGKQKLTVWL